MNTEAQFLGDLDPLYSRRHVKRPERRQVSKRWLASSVMVGVTSLVLMGGALFAALDGRQQLTLPAQAYERTSSSEGSLRLALKGNHPGLFAKIKKGEPSGIIMASTSTQQGDKVIVKAKPFLNIETSLAAAPRPLQGYPPFNALAVFSESGEAQTVARSSDLMYGADVESEVALNLTEFPYEEFGRKFKPRKRSNEIRRQVRAYASNLELPGNQVAALADFDPDRFSDTNTVVSEYGDVTITAENVSILGKVNNDAYLGTWYEDRLIEVRADATISQVFQAEGLDQSEIEEISTVLSSDLGTDQLKEGDTLQAYFQHETISNGERLKTLARVSLFRGTAHLVSIARPDEPAIKDGSANDVQFVYAIQPESPLELFEESIEKPIIASGNLPSVYDGIYRAALSEGLTEELAGALVKILAFDVDFKSRLTPTDRLEVFLSLEEGQERPTEESEILYAGITLGNVTRRYYRFGDKETGIVDYYDETGKSSKKFLLRKPVPNGRFRSPFGMRRHPISRVFKLHGGVDWSAPRGTPIIAAGNAVVQKAGWSSGYGKQTILRHANGYVTSYSHQTAFAKGIRPGVRVRQGQVIGFVGSTGYSTGPHLHYEVLVNGNRVDPMRIRLPKGKVLKDEELAAFEAERDRVNELVNRDKETEVAVN